MWIKILSRKRNRSIFISLFELWSEYFKLGYLAVFDARDEELPDTGLGMTIDQIPEKDRPAYYRHIKLDDFRVINEHPN